MSGRPAISCEGAPRDLGLDQGAHCAPAVRERVRRVGGHGDWLGRWRPFDGRARRRDAASARDVRRHFPHLDERLIGLAQGADVPLAALHHLLARDPEEAEAAVRVGVRGDGPGLVVAGLSGEGCVRCCRPDAGFASLEWTLPWLPGALCGVNEGGLAGAVVRRAAEPAGGRFAAPAFLLLQNCLQQHDTVASALEWCERRPAGGHAELVFADATGDLGAIEVHDDTRKRRDEIPPLTAPSGTIVTLDPVARTLNDHQL